MVSFFENGDRYNLLNSAVLDLLDFIRRENLKTLLEHLVGAFVRWSWRTGWKSVHAASSKISTKPPL